MSVAFYMDVHVHKAITVGLRLRGVDVLTAQEDDAKLLPDSDLLTRATTLGRALFTYDDDLLREATYRQIEGVPFAGIVYIHLMDVMIGRCIDDLELIAKINAPEDLANYVQYLPL